MEVGLEVWGHDYRRVETACRLADRLGLDSFAYGESPHELNLECWTVLASLARATRRIRLGPVIANVLPSYRSAFLLARQVETLAEIAPGRIELRTGVGAATHYGRNWWAPHGVEYPTYDRRLDYLESALQEWEQRWDGQSVDIPILLAATGERAMTLAARHAHIWETSFCTPHEHRERSRHFDGLAVSTAPGRSVARSLEIDGFVAPNAAELSQLLDQVRRDRGGDEDLEPVFERALVGTPDAVGQQLVELSDAGVDRVLVALHDPLDLDAIEALARARDQARQIERPRPRQT